MTTVLVFIGLFTGLGLTAVVTAGATVSGFHGAKVALILAGAACCFFFLPIIAVESDAPELFTVAALILLVGGIYGTARYFVSTTDNDGAAALAGGGYALGLLSLVCASMGDYLVIVGGMILAVATIPSFLSLIYADGSRVDAEMRNTSGLIAAAFWILNTVLILAFG